MVSLLRSKCPHSFIFMLTHNSLYIALYWWPLPIASTTHLDIMATYRNDTFRLTNTIEGVRAAQAAQQDWSEATRHLPRGSFGAAADRYGRDRKIDTRQPDEEEQTEVLEETNCEIAIRQEANLTKLPLTQPDKLRSGLHGIDVCSCSRPRIWS